jgi:hypothetical protein
LEQNGQEIPMKVIGTKVIVKYGDLNNRST